MTDINNALLIEIADLSGTSNLSSKDSSWLAIAPENPELFGSLENEVIPPVNPDLSIYPSIELESNNSNFSSKLIGDSAPLNETELFRDSEIFIAGTLVQATEGEIFRQDAESSNLVNLPSFRSDARFQNIDGRNFSVVVIDTGIDRDHPFFGPDANGDGIADRIVYQWDFADNDNDASDIASSSFGGGHGSNVASIVGGNGSVSGFQNYRGIAPGVNLIILKVFSSVNGSGSFLNIERALQWTRDNVNNYNIASVNMSLGDNNNYSNPLTTFLSDEMAALANQNVTVVSAAGNRFFPFNSVQGVSYPAADPNSLAVGAVYDANVGRQSYSSGAVANSTGVDRITPFSQRHATQTEVFAPGGVITGANQSGGLASYQGTSQAAPFVAGSVALAQQLALQTLNRRLTVLELTNLFRTTGTTINDGDDENDNVTNTGLNFRRLDMVSLGNAILNMAPPPPPPVASLSPATISLSEGNSGTTAFVYTVTLDRASSQIVTLNYSTNDGSATLADNDYIDNDGILTFNPGETSKTIQVLVNGDTKFEGDENFFVRLNSASNATINSANQQSQGMILNDDSVPLAALSPATISLSEGNSGTTAFVYTVTLDRSSSQTVTLNYSTNDGSATLADNDYIDNDGILTFNPGETSKTIQVLVNGDTKFEGDENFSVRLNSASNATINSANQESQGIILNDDAAPPPPPSGLAVTINGTTQNYNLSSYSSGQDIYSVTSINGNELNLAGNSWKQISISTYTITRQTVLEFEFRSTRRGEVHGIGLDSDNIMSPERIFSLYGAENFGINTFRNYANNAGSGTESAPWVSYRINVGQFLRSFTNRDNTRTMNNIVFSMDDDLLPNPVPEGQLLANSQFRNLRLYEDLSLPLSTSSSNLGQGGINNSINKGLSSNPQEVFTQNLPLPSHNSPVFI